MSNVPKSISESTLMQKGLPFPDYDNETTFRWIESMLREDGFKDSSYCNDVCPTLSFGYYETGHTAVSVFIDYKRQSRREIKDNPMFTVITTSDEDAELNKTHAVTDNAQLAIAMAVSAAQALREWHETRTAEYRGADYGDDDKPTRDYWFETEVYFDGTDWCVRAIDRKGDHIAGLIDTKHDKKGHALYEARGYFGSQRCKFLTVRRRDGRNDYVECATNDHNTHDWETCEPATPKPDLYFTASKPTSSVIDQLEKTISDVARQVDLLVAGGDR